MLASKEAKRILDAAVIERLRELRLSTGMTQEAFAAHAGVSKASVVNLENQRQGPTLLFLYQVAAAFGLGIGDLLPSVDEVVSASRAQEPADLISSELPPEWVDLVKKG